MQNKHLQVQLQRIDFSEFAPTQHHLSMMSRELHRLAACHYEDHHSNELEQLVSMVNDLSNLHDKNRFAFKESAIHGDGLFSVNDVDADTLFCEGVMINRIPILNLSDFKISTYLSKVNHSFSPNAALKRVGTHYFLLSLEEIGADNEITLDYQKFPWYLSRDTKNFI